MKKFWSAIELLPQWCTVLAEWRWLLGQEFELVAGRLRPTGKSALSYPQLTADGYGPPYRVVAHANGQLAGVTEGGRTIPLTRADVALHVLSPRDLLREVGGALGLDVQLPPIDAMVGICQIGSVLPIASQRRLVFFICTLEQSDVRKGVERLTSRHQEPFVLLVPTPRCLDSESLALLESRRAVAVVLQDVLGLDDQGNWSGLQPMRILLSHLATGMSAPADHRSAPVPEDPSKWARQIELVRATNQVLSDGGLNPGVLSKACNAHEIGTNGKMGRGSLVDVRSFLTWLGRKRGLDKIELDQVRNAIMGEISDRK